MTLTSPLVRAFTSHPLGLCGAHDPAGDVGSIKSLEQRLNVIALGSVLDIKPLSPERWSALVAMHDNWLLDTSRVAYRSSAEVSAGMREAHLSAPQHIPRVWWQICRGVQGRYKGSWRDLLRANDDTAEVLQSYLQKNGTTFPVLSGPVIAARWLDRVHRIGGVTLQGWDRLSVALPAHQQKTARLFGIEMNEVHPLVSSALNTWQTSCQGLSEEVCGLAECPGRKQDE